jgi:hypothetical protein
VAVTWKVPPVPYTTLVLLALVIDGALSFTVTSVVLLLTVAVFIPFTPLFVFVTAT